MIILLYVVILLYSDYYYDHLANPFTCNLYVCVHERKPVSQLVINNFQVNCPRTIESWCLVFLKLWIIFNILLIDQISK